MPQGQWVLPRAEALSHDCLYSGLMPVRRVFVRLRAGVPASPPAEPDAPEVPPTPGKPGSPQVPEFPPDRVPPIGDPTPDGVPEPVRDPPAMIIPAFLSRRWRLLGQTRSRGDRRGRVPPDLISGSLQVALR